MLLEPGLLLCFLRRASRCFGLALARSIRLELLHQVSPFEMERSYTRNAVQRLTVNLELVLCGLERNHEIFRCATE